MRQRPGARARGPPRAERAEPRAAASAFVFLGPDGAIFLLAFGKREGEGREEGGRIEERERRMRKGVPPCEGPISRAGEERVGLRSFLQSLLRINHPFVPGYQLGSSFLLEAFRKKKKFIFTHMFISLQGILWNEERTQVVFVCSEKQRRKAL